MLSSDMMVTICQTSAPMSTPGKNTVLPDAFRKTWTEGILHALMNC